MKIQLFPVAFMLLQISHAAEAEYHYEAPFDHLGRASPGGAQAVIQSNLSSPCEFETSQVFAFDSLHDGPIPFSTSASQHPLSPRLTSGLLNASTGEQWEFDATFPAGDSGVLVAFYRDPEFNFLGPGNLRVSLDVTFPDGTGASLVDYAESSVVSTSCTAGGDSGGGHVSGAWLRRGASYRFRVARDMSAATVTLDTPNVRGTVELRGTARPRCADGSVWEGLSPAAAAPSSSSPPPPAASADVKSAEEGGPGSGASIHRTIPGMYWMEPMPASRASVDLQVRDGRRLAFSGGMGGSERIWQARTWFDMLLGYKFFRAVVGPYAMSYWTSTSRDHQVETDSGTRPLEVGNVMLFEDGQPVFSSSRGTSSVHQGEDHFVYRPTYDGSVRSSVGAQKETGYDVEMVSPSRARRWSFHFEHKQVMFEFNLGRGAGGTSFMGLADGGEEGGEIFQGSFLNEAVDFQNLWIPSFVVSTLRTAHYVMSSVRSSMRQAVEMVQAYQM